MAAAAVEAEILKRLGGSGGLSDAVLVAVVAKSVPGATPAAVRAALEALSRRSAVRRDGGRWFGSAPATAPPADGAALLEIVREGLQLPALSPAEIEVHVDGLEDEDPPVDPAAEARWQALLATAEDDGTGRRVLELTPEMLEEVVGPPDAPRLPSPQQVRAVAWLISHPKVVLAAVQQLYADQGRRGRPVVADRRRELPSGFGVTRVRVRDGHGVATLELSGWCGWDEEHGWELTVDETEA